MKSYHVGSWSGLIPALWLCLALPAGGATESVVVFGLTNTPIGSAVLDLRGNDLVVRGFPNGGPGGITHPSGFPAGLEGAYGVSIQRARLMPESLFIPTLTVSRTKARSSWAKPLDSWTDRRIN